MREIKFRAWDRRDGKYFWPWPEGFALVGETTCFDCIGQQLSESGRSSILGLNDVLVEQFTGLHDKNGREVYEGDILSHYACGRESIVYEPDYAGFIFARSHGRFDCDWACESAVVGNIHENPELLPKE